MTRGLSYWGARLNEEFEFKTSGEIQTKAYEDDLGYWTGPGGVRYHQDGTEVKKGDTWTEAEAYALYGTKLKDFCEHVEREVKVDLNDDQFSACVLLAWNVGKTNFSNSTVLERINEGRFEDASAAFLMWRRGTLHGGEIGWDGEPARDPDGNIMEEGLRWFKLVRGILRRHVCEALLFNGLSWACTYDPNIVQLKGEPQPDRKGWTDKETYSSNWRDILNLARREPLPSPPENTELAPEQPVAPVAKGEARHAETSVVSVPDEIVLTEKVEEPAPAKKPVGNKPPILNQDRTYEIDESLPTKRMEDSQRFIGAMLTAFGHFLKKAGFNGAAGSGIFGTATTFYLAIIDSPVLLAAMTGVTASAFFGALWVVGKFTEKKGVKTQKQGEVDAVQGLH